MRAWAALALAGCASGGGWLGPPSAEVCAARLPDNGIIQVVESRLVLLDRGAPVAEVSIVGGGERCARVRAGQLTAEVRSPRPDGTGGPDACRSNVLDLPVAAGRDTTLWITPLVGERGYACGWKVGPEYPVDYARSMGR